jgi:hypothetical protein
MATNQYKLLASAPTIEGIKRMIAEYFYGGEKELTANGENTWNVSGNKGLIIQYRVVLKKSRYRFEILSAAL